MDNIRRLIVNNRTWIYSGLGISVLASKLKRINYYLVMLQKFLFNKKRRALSKKKKENVIEKEIPLLSEKLLETIVDKIKNESILDLTIYINSLKTYKLEDVIPDHKGHKQEIIGMRESAPDYYSRLSKEEKEALINGESEKENSTLRKDAKDSI